MSNYLTQDAFIKALIDKFDGPELAELLGLTTKQIVDAFYNQILEAQEGLEDELKYGH
jgi:hypothetical protein